MTVTEAWPGRMKDFLNIMNTCLHFPDGLLCPVLYGEGGLRHLRSHDVRLYKTLPLSPLSFSKYLVCQIFATSGLSSEGCTIKIKTVTPSKREKEDSKSHSIEVTTFLLIIFVEFVFLFIILTSEDKFKSFESLVTSAICHYSSDSDLGQS